MLRVELPGTGGISSRQWKSVEVAAIEALLGSDQLGFIFFF
jgi:hypothetical protein